MRCNIKNKLMILEQLLFSWYHTTPHVTVLALELLDTAALEPKLGVFLEFITAANYLLLSFPEPSRSM